MRPSIRGLIRSGTAALGLLALAAVSAHADITLIGRYTLANGDTVTRASYYTSKRMRTTLPNGMEIVYDHARKRVALVDHAAKRYWEGPLAQADSIAFRMRAQRAESLAANASPEAFAKWSEVLSTLNDSTKFHRLDKSRKILGYPCTAFILESKPYLRQERWVARSLDVADFSGEIANVAIATVQDPLGRGLLKLVLENHDVDGLTLSGTIDFISASRQGHMSWETLVVGITKIPESVWAIPADYSRWEPPVGASKP